MTSDREQRLRAEQDTRRSLVVEASAGTGKTTTLVKRVLHLVLESGPYGPPVPLSGICAITFTEKAAGEMKIRLRQSLEGEASGGGRRAELALRALRDLETAAISTFHAFAVSLLKERPVEGGVDPRFTVLDEVQSGLLFREVWDAWIHRAIGERRGALEAALRGGFDLETLRSLAQALKTNAHLVRTLELLPPPSEAAARDRVREMLERAGQHRGLALDPRDRLLQHLEDAIAWLQDPEGSPVRPQRPGSAGSRRNWRGGSATVASVQEFVRTVADFHEAWGGLRLQRLLDAVIRWLRDDLLAAWQARKEAEGFLEFEDQIRAARRLLQKSRAARRDFQKRFAALLVDEFQDTDRPQLDIVLLLSSTDLDTSDPARLKPDPGRLFIVGDPKQSIYRFRGADIETYLGLVEEPKLQEMGLERVEIRTNFRSVPSILAFVDEAFLGTMRKSPDGFYQSAYSAFGGAGARPAGPCTPAAALLAERNPQGKLAGSGGAFVKLEAARVVKLIRAMRGSEAWAVEDSTGPGRLRLPRYGDIAVLLPVLTRTDALEDELRGAGIPYVLEGGKFYYARSEVASAVTVLRSVANPNDAVALYGALRSIFFGISDEDLLQAHVDGIPLDYRVAPPAGSPLRRPFEILHELHRSRFERPVSETFERLLQCTGAREVLAVRGFQSIANLGKLARTLRALQPGKTFTDVVESLRMMDEEGIAETESRVMEERSDAVRVLSVHKAKGLDFPIVIVAGMGLKRRNRSSAILTDVHRRKIFAVGMKTRELRIESPGWTELCEEEARREEQELIRLLYVALTRARDYLVLSTHHSGRGPVEGGTCEADFSGTRLKPLASFLSDLAANPRGLARILDGPEVDGLRVSAAGGTVPEPPVRPAGLLEEYAVLRGMLKETPAGADLRAAGRDETGTFERMEERTVATPSIRLGLAFHEAMETADLLDPARAADWASHAGALHDLAPQSISDLSELIDRAMHSPLLERARRAARCGARVCRELPYVRPVAGPRSAVSEGKIDLLFEEAGGWVLVDYKTDRVPAGVADTGAFFRERYGHQIDEYRTALRELGLQVKEAHILLARTGESVEM